MDHYDDEQTINVGCGEDVSIAELAALVREIVHPDAEISYDSSQPDGTPRKLLDVSRIRQLGWSPQIGLRDGIRTTYDWFVEQNQQIEA